MENFREKEMYIYNPETATETFGDFISRIPTDFDGLVFYKIRRDAIGKSGGNPTWGDLYEYKNYEMYYSGNCIFKEMDYDAPESAYAEKLWSLLGKRVLKNCRVPDITLAKDPKYNETCVLSHIILDNLTEDLIDMKTLLFYKFDRQTLEKLKSVVNIQDLLECIKIQINDEDNYKQVENQVVQALLLDCVSNNADRHANNWCLVRNKNTNVYSIGLFDHSSSFVDMMSPKNGSAIDGWTSTYTKVATTPSLSGMGDLGNKVLQYLFNNYPEASKEFFKNFNDELENFYKDIETAPSNIDKNRIKQNLSYKKRYMEEILLKINDPNKGGMERD